MPTDDIGFRIRMLSNLINRRINQMIAEEETSLTAHQSWGFNYITNHSVLVIMLMFFVIEFSMGLSTAWLLFQLLV